MDDKQTFHYRPLVVVRMCKSLRKIFSISSRAVWGFGPGRFTQSEPCCHFANISADCALHHHFVRPWVSCRAGERFLPPDALWGMRFLSLNWKHSLFLCYPVPLSLLWFLSEQRSVERRWWKVGWPWGRSVLLPAPACSLMSQTPMHPAVPDLLPKPFGAALLLCHSSTSVEWKWSSVDITKPHTTSTAQKAMFILHLPQNKKDDSPSGWAHPSPRRAHLWSTRYFASLSSASSLI